MDEQPAVSHETVLPGERTSTISHTIGIGAATTPDRSRWTTAVTPRPSSRADVFCFPFAGGGASLFRGWANKAPSDMTLRPVQLPGREERMMERPFDRITELVTAAADSLVPLLDRPFALFGHSMGALICFELAHELRRRGALMPRRLFVSGAPAPQRAAETAPIYHLPDDDFLEEIRRYGGLPDEVLRSRELLDLLMPRLRADMAITGAYTYTDRPPLICGITAFGGSRDETVTPDRIEAWREQTVGRFQSHFFPGEHFFLLDSAPEILRIVANDLA